MAFLAWMQLIVTIVAIGVAVAALGFGVVSRPALKRLRRVAPRTRFHIVALLAALPVLMGGLAVGIAFAPSALDALGLVRDHCAHHPGHDFHLCFLHGAPPAVSTWAVVVQLVLIGGLMSTWFGEAARVVRSQRWASQLSRLSRYDSESNSWMVETGRAVAFSVGFLRPRVYVSERARGLLSASQFRAVIAHEHAHVRRRDALVKSIVRLLAWLHLPAVRKRLLDELELAAEQACDQSAVSEVDDRLTVAEAILAMQRAGSAERLPIAAASFGAGAVEERVRAILDDDWTPLRRGATAAGLLLAAGAAWLVTSYHELHHLSETLLAYLF